jgi:hypothetical protein
MAATSELSGGALVDSSTIGLSLFLGSLVFVGLVAILGGFLHARRERLLTHAERMKALELGKPLPDDPQTTKLKAIYGTGGGSVAEGSSDGLPQASLAATCYRTALWVAFWGFLFAAQSGAMNLANGVAIAIGASTGAIGVTCVICGTILAALPTKAAARVSYDKAHTDPDAIDVVGSRG